MPETHAFADNRYESMPYRRSGRSGLRLPAISLGCWHNFGDEADQTEAERMLLRAFDLGINHFDLANNYGPPGGSAERNVGRILKRQFADHRDELILSTKAGFYMWPGPYGDNGSRKYLLASLDQSLRRLGVDYVDIYYHHRPDNDTPLEETMMALDQAVRSGKALYAGISNYGADGAAHAYAILRALGTPLLIDQVSYSMLNRWIEPDLVSTAGVIGVGLICFSPLHQGMLSDKYLDGIPEQSRAADPHGFLKPDAITPERQELLKALNAIAQERGQSLAQMALQWVLRDKRVTSALIGARNVAQIEENAAAVNGPELDAETLKRIDATIAGERKPST